MEVLNNPTTSTFRNREGQKLYYKVWTGKNNNRGGLLIVHGLNSHSSYYDNFAKMLVENNFMVYAIDLRGRGESEGERYYISNYRNIIDDIDLLINIIKSEDPSNALFILGHSAGGIFASIYTAHYQHKLKGLISESFALELPVPKFMLVAIKFLGRIIPHLRLIQLNNKGFSRNNFIVEKMNRDPMILKERQPTKTMQQLILAAEYLKEIISDIEIPILILHGTQDKITKPTGSEYFMKHVYSKDKQLNLYEGYYHDLLNDKYNEIIIRDIIRWLNDRTKSNDLEGNY